MSGIKQAYLQSFPLSTTNKVDRYISFLISTLSFGCIPPNKQLIKGSICKACCSSIGAGLALSRYQAYQDSPGRSLWNICASGVAGLNIRSTWAFSIQGICTISKDKKNEAVSFTYLRYFSIVGALVSNSLQICPIINYESSKALRCQTLSSQVSQNSKRSASYSFSLLEALKLKQSSCSMMTPFRLARIFPASDPPALDAQSTWRVQSSPTLAPLVLAQSPPS